MRAAPQSRNECCRDKVNRLALRLQRIPPARRGAVMQAVVSFEPERTLQQEFAVGVDEEETSLAQFGKQAALGPNPNFWWEQFQRRPGSIFNADFQAVKQQASDRLRLARGCLSSTVSQPTRSGE